MKQYEVEVYGRNRHGKYGRTHYFGLVLSTENREAAADFAIEVVSEMTGEEFIERCLDKAKPEARCMFMYRRRGEKIGLEFAERIFKYEARVFRG